MTYSIEWEFFNRVFRASAILRRGRQGRKKGEREGERLGRKKIMYKN